MNGPMETSFDLLRAWEVTNLYEKAYFLSVHVLLLLLGIYSIRNRAYSKKLRPASGDDHVAQKTAGSQEFRKLKNQKEKGLTWANQIGTWLLKNCESCVDESLDAWRLKMNGRLLSNTSKGKVQIEAIDKEAIRFEVTGITSNQQESGDQMGLAVYMNIEELTLHLKYSNEAQTDTQTIMKFQAVSSTVALNEASYSIQQLFTQLTQFNGKIKVHLKLGGIQLNNNSIILDKELDENNSKIIKDAFKKSLINSVSLEATRGILKKEIKSDVKNKETQASDNRRLEVCVNSWHRERGTDAQSFPETSDHSVITELESPRHIFVTDLDSAIAKVASEEASMSANKKKSLNKASRGLPIVLPARQAGLMPEIKVQPATPLQCENDPHSFISKQYPTSPEPVSNFLTLAEEKVKTPDTLVTVKGDAFISDAEDKSNVSTEDASVVSVELSLLAKANDGSVVDEDEQTNEDEPSPARQDYICAKDIVNEAEPPENVCLDDFTILEYETEKDEDAGAVREDEASPKQRNVILEESDTTSQRAILENVIIKEDRRRPRPKSLYEFGDEGSGNADQSFDENMLHFEKKTRNEVTRVNTFHLGSKSMVSIAVTPKRANSAILRTTASQLSLTSPVGYSPSKPSALIIESDEQGKKRYYHVPPAVARKGTYEQRGVKLHVYNGHLFVAQHFSKPLPACSVCSLPLARRMGKQGYQCRDCKIIVHKRCHNLIGHGCEESSFPNLNIEYPWSTDV